MKMSQPSRKPVCNFTVRKKELFRCPFSRYQLHAFSSNPKRQVTDHYNYGFNHVSMALFAKVSTRLREAHLAARSHSTPYEAPLLENYRFNDQIPLEFGGTGPPVDKSLEDKMHPEALFKKMIKLRLQQFKQARKKNKELSSEPLSLNLLMESFETDQKCKVYFDKIQQHVSKHYDKAIAQLTKPSRRGMTSAAEDTNTTCQPQGFVNPYEELFIVQDETLERKRSFSPKKPKQSNHPRKRVHRQERELSPPKVKKEEEDSFRSESSEAEPSKNGHEARQKKHRKHKRERSASQDRHSHKAKKDKHKHKKIKHKKEKKYRHRR